MPNEKPLVSVTVCVRDGVDWVDGCLESLTAQTHRPLEIIAIDDGSSDGSKEKLLAWHQEEGEIPIRIFTQDAKGLSAGRQLALKQTQGEWVAITDIDVRPEPDWISNMILEIQPIDSQEQVVAITGRTVFEHAGDVVSRVRSVEIATKYRSRPRRTSLANGPCSMFKRESLLEIGGFNPTWYHAEDMEVSLRLIANGGTIVYAPDAVVHHVPEIESGRFLAKRRRDARAHMRIVRHFPRGKRQGPELDFIGSSTFVLTVFPLWIMALATGIPFIFSFITQPDWTWEDAKYWWQTRLLLATLGLMLIHEFILWRGPLGVVNRGAIKQGKWSLLTVFKIRNLTLRWSIALWQGLFLGIKDAVRGANGHRKLFGKNKK
ncbi:MAG: glycosyltransferase family A protein [Candidatus Poseidoniaceae archaeon]|jgi:cellulose synthase/poly-beta-1,6-N-acetylglucosamine synthase-like glycosyltransferase|tara:strand:- start:14112 stop:15239 length:1128 start_codon:yes stop_codon:yes gene_type:complete